MDLLERWVGEYQPGVYRAACLILRDTAAAEDVAQETFLRAARAARDVAPGDDTARWLYRIAVNLSLNTLRARQREQRALSRMGQPPDAAPDGTDGRIMRATVAQALERLPERFRIPIILRYYLDMTEKEMAGLLGIRQGTVKSRLHEARRLLSMDQSIEAAHSGIGEG